MTAFLIREIDVRGGTHKQLLELLDFMRAQGEDFKVLTNKLDFDKTFPGFARQADRIIEIKREPVVRWWRRSLADRVRYVKYLRGLVADAQSINIHDNGFERYLWAFFGKRVIWQINDVPSVFQTGVSKGRKLKLKDHLEKWKIRLFSFLFVDQITVNVSKNAQRVKRCLFRRADVLYCGITPVNVEHENGPTLERFKNGKVRLLSSGVFFPYRNYETLVLAVDALREKGIDAELNIFGTTQYSPDYHHKIQTLIDKRKLSSQIRILGQIDEELYRKLHEESDIFCFVNIDQSWGLAVFEAMSAGLPVVVSRSVGATEILHDGSDATFVDPMDVNEIADAIEGLVRKPMSYIQFQREGLRLVGQYTWANAYCRPLLEIIKGKRSK